MEAKRRMKGATTCKRCGDYVDRSACGETSTTFTIRKDDGEKTTRIRGYLCGFCSTSLESFLAGYKGA